MKLTFIKPLLVTMLFSCNLRSQSVDEPFRVVLSKNKEGKPGAIKLPVKYKRLTPAYAPQPVLTDPVIVVPGNGSEITLPKGTFIWNEFTIDKAILPENHKVTITLGDNTIKPGMIIGFENGDITNLYLPYDNYPLKVGNDTIRFRNEQMGGYGVGFHENGQVKCGFLMEDIQLQINGKSVFVESKYTDRIDENGFGDILFYENGMMRFGMLKSETELYIKNGNPVWVKPGWTTLNDDGTLKWGNLKDDVDVVESDYSFKLLSTLNNHGDDYEDRFAYFDKGKLMGDFLTVKNLKTKLFSGEGIKLAKISITEKGLFPLELHLSGRIKLDVKTLKYNWREKNYEEIYSQPISFGPNPRNKNEAPESALADISFTFEKGHIHWGYLGEDTEIKVGEEYYVFRKESFIRFYECNSSDRLCGSVEVGILSKERIVDSQGIKYKLLPGYEAKFSDDGKIIKNFNSPWAHQRDYILKMN